MKKIPLTNSDKFAFVDDEDYKKVCKFKLCLANGHARYSKKGVYLHVFLFGEAPDGLEWDHKNRNGLDCRRENLRLATHSENCRNRGKRTGKTRVKQSKFMGVSWYPRLGKWVTKIKIGRKNLHLGYFSEDVDAARVRDSAAFRHFGKFSVLNFPIKRFPRTKSCKI